MCPVGEDRGRLERTTTRRGGVDYQRVTLALLSWLMKFQIPTDDSKPENQARDNWRISSLNVVL